MFQNSSIMEEALASVPIPHTVTVTIDACQQIVTPPIQVQLPCEVCGKTFGKKFQLNRHMKLHTDDKPHKCDFCDKAFFYASNLNQHRRSHTGEKPYNCGECGKRFAKLSGLKNHIFTHTGQMASGSGQGNVPKKEFTCNVCGRSFPQKYQMKRHLDMHMAGRSERSYKCRVCGDVAPNYHAFIAHTNVHLVPPSANPARKEGKWCSICERNISDSELVDNKCETCGKKKITNVTWKTV